MPEYTAGIFIINHKKEILLTHATHSAMKNWGIPKGLVNIDLGEGYIDGAIREVEEEIGIKILDSSIIHHLGNMKYTSGSTILVAFYLFLEDLGPNSIQIVKDNIIYSFNKSIETIDISLLSCSSMVIPRTENELAFPEVDAFQWFSLDLAENILYKPQKALIPGLKKVIRTRAKI